MTNWVATYPGVPPATLFSTTRGEGTPIVIDTATGIAYFLNPVTNTVQPLGSAGGGTVTSVDVAAPAEGITASGGPITTSGTITLALANDLAAVEGLTTFGVVSRIGDGVWVTGAGGSGTVTSVAATVPSFLSISGSPITTSGTLAITYSGTALPVANGGTGVTSATAYGTLVGGTTSTGPFQSVSPGTAGYVLTSNGASAAPTFQNPSALALEDIVVACSDETTALTTGQKVEFQLMRARTLLAVAAGLTTAQASGSIFTVDIKLNGTSVFSTLLTVDNTEKTSSTATTPAVLSTSAIAAYDIITIHITQVGDGTATGLKVMFFWAFP